MNLAQATLDKSIANVAALAACDVVLVARKTHSAAVVGSPIDVELADSANEPHGDQGVPVDPQPARGDDLHASAVAGRLSAATLAAVDKVARYYADAKAARAGQLLHTEIGVDRVPILAPRQCGDAMNLSAMPPVTVACCG